MAAKEHVERHGFNGFFREDRYFGSLPVVRSDIESVHLSPQGRTILVGQIEVEGIIAVAAATYVDGLAPGGGYYRLWVLLIDQNRLGDAALDLRVAAIVANEDVVLFSETLVPGLPGIRA